MRILLLPCHSILEYDELRLFASLGHEVASLGAYLNPSAPMDNKRPPLDVPVVEYVKHEVDLLGAPGVDNIDKAKRDLPESLIDWADVIIVSGFEHAYLIPQWNRIKHKRVIWRTIGQSAHPNEWMMQPLRKEGCQIVRYSPKERHIPEFAGEDAVIRFYKDPDEWTGWTGENPVVTNVTQGLYTRSLADDGLLQMRGYQWTSYGFWKAATEGLPVKLGGLESQVIGGAGLMTTDEMKALLRTSRAYLATGTQPASYVLNFIEALMTGIPVVSIGPDWFCILPYGHKLLEMHEIAPLFANDPQDAHAHLERMLREPEYATEIGAEGRRRAIDLFGMDTIKREWAAFLLGYRVPERARLEAVAA